jgi:perosamine synthetase
LTSGGVPFYKPWITNQDEKAISQALKSRWLTGGPIAAKFENQFAEYVGVKCAVSVNSCTAALHLAMRVLNIKSGDEVIVPDVTFAATANAALFVGAKPVFADVDEKTFNISPNDVLNKITPKTKAIIPVHYGGQSCDMKELMDIAQDYKLHIVEDCAHSLGAEYEGKKTGSFGIFGCFSFYPTKIITTLEGGMITTNDENLAKKLQILREHGMSKSAIDRESQASWYYDVVDLGYNYRLNELQAALGSSQLERVKDGIKMRMEAAHYYGERLKFNGITIPYKAARRSHIYHLYVIKVDEGKFGESRDELFKKLSEKQVGLSLHYTPLHKLSFYQKFLNGTDKFPVAEQIYRQILSLPLYPTMTETDLDYVIESIGENTVC